MDDKAMVAMEVRAVPTEVRMDESGRLQGVGVPYGSWSSDLGGFRERFLPGAFSQSVAAHDIRCIFNHDSNYVLGRKSSGTLMLREEDDGLHYSVEPPDAQWARDLMASIRRGDIRENSFGFFIESREDEEWEEREGVYWRTVRRATMRELGPQTFPAYPQSSVSVRSVDAVLADVRERMAPGFVGRHPSVLALEMEMEAE